MRLDDDLDRIMARDDEIVPSSGFASSVMDAVRSEAAAPPAIPFPWKRALPGLLTLVVSIAWSVWDAVRVPAQQSAPAVPSNVTHWFDGVVPLFDRARMFGAEWLLLGLLVTFVGLKLTWRLAGRSL